MRLDRNVTMTVSDAALRIARTFPIFPLGEKSKIPLIPKAQGGNGCLDATRDLEQIKAWWSEYPDANIGLATGSTLIVLDIDNREAEQRAADKGLPTTVMARTPHGSHRFYSKPPDMIVGNAAALFGVVGIDRRGDGGYVAVSPSVTTCQKTNCEQHRSGELLGYHWAVGKPMAPAPEWLIEARPSTGASPDSLRIGGAIDLSGWVDLAAKGVAVGARHVELVRLTGFVLGSSLEPRVGRELLHAWNAARCKPPLPHAEVERVVQDIAAKELRRQEPRRVA